MLRNLKAWHRPETVDEALALLEKGRVVAHGGGTSLMTVAGTAIEEIVDLGRLPLKNMKASRKEFRVEAGVTLAELAAWPALTGPAAILAEAAGRAASAPLRNRITAGGSVARLLPWSDLPPALLALDAAIEVAGTAAGVFQAADFFAKNPLDGTSLVTALIVPRGKGGAAFHKVSRTRFDYSFLDLAVLLSLKKGAVEKVRIAVGCAVPRPMRVTGAEDALIGRKPDADTFRRATECARLEPVRDSRASAAYREQLFRVHLQRCLEEALARAGEEAP
jgi:carbon-monoxide dehydrogenase medium subunit